MSDVGVQESTGGQREVRTSFGRSDRMGILGPSQERGGGVRERRRGRGALAPRARQLIAARRSFPPRSCAPSPFRPVRPASTASTATWHSPLESIC